MSAGPSGGLYRFVIAGRLNRDYILPISGKPLMDGLGGNLAYAAVGLSLWHGTAGLVARVDAAFPKGKLQRFQQLGFDLSGISTTPYPLDMRRFLAYADDGTAYTKNPVQHFADRGIPFPPALLGYQPGAPQYSSRTQTTPRAVQISELPDEYLEASAVHICQIDYLSHQLLPSLFRQGRATTITLSSDPGYMSPTFWDEIPGLLSEITAFITTEAEMRAVFHGKQTDLWVMAEQISRWGPEFILIRSERWGYGLFDRDRGKRLVIPDYQTRVVDPTGAGDAFAGGFLAGYRQYYDPVEAALMGSAAASLIAEGVGVFFALEAMPGLLDLRREALRDLVREL